METNGKMNHLTEKRINLCIRNQNNKYNNRKKEIIMKKVFLMIAAVMMTAMSVKAQSDEPKNELSVSYGIGISLIGDGMETLSVTESSTSLLVTSGRTATDLEHWV